MLFTFDGFAVTVDLMYLITVMTLFCLGQPVNLFTVTFIVLSDVLEIIYLFYYPLIDSDL